MIDCYRDASLIQRNPFKVALYISMFPQLVAGPIVRYTEVRRQIDERRCSAEQSASGLRRFAVGLGKKAIIANSLAEVTEEIFSHPPEENLPAVAWFGAVAYLLQLYHDFSGYSDMAIGLGRMLGFRYPENFNYPFCATSVTDYWRRWHMSLSGWFRDYVYIPLGGSRKGVSATYRNILVVWILTGIWHGANWTFLVWGMIFCAFILLERRTGLAERLGPAAHVYVMVVAIVAFVFFNSPSVEHALRFVGVMVGIIPSRNVGFDIGWYADRYIVFIFILGMIGGTPLVKALWRKISGRLPETAYTACANILALGLLGVSAIYVMTSTYNPFIYFQF